MSRSSAEVLMRVVSTVSHLTETDHRGQFSPEEIRAARDRIYEGWWTYNPNIIVPFHLRPGTTVIVHSASERRLAELAQPPVMRAFFVVEQRQPKRS